MSMKKTAAWQKIAADVVEAKSLLSALRQTYPNLSDGFRVIAAVQAGLITESERDTVSAWLSKQKIGVAV